MTLKRVFDCPIKYTDCEQTHFDGTDIALAIRETKSYLTTGKLSTIIVVRQPNGRWKVQTNVIAFIAAHTLGLLSIPAQELIDGNEVYCSKHSDGPNSIGP
jgi:hypothetical protein